MTESLEAGRELDVAIAVRVFGWVQRTTESNTEQLVTVPPDWTDLRTRRWLGHDINELVPAYSTEIAAAWAVVDRLFELRWQVDIWCEAPNTLGIPKWHVMLKPFGAPIKWKTVGSTAPEAICRAALRAVQTEDPPMQRLPIGEPGQFIKVKP